MTPCETVRDSLSALLDGELTTSEEPVRAHLAGCADCQRVFAELERDRAVLGDEFRSAIEAAPPAPALAMGRFVRLPFGKTVTGTAAAAAIVVAGFFLFGDNSVGASPLTLLERTALHHRGLRDVEIFATLESGVVELISKLSGKAPKNPKRSHFRALVKKPNRFVLHEVENLSSRKALPSGQRMGFDGDRFWDYQHEQGVVVVKDAADIKFQSGGTSFSFKKNASDQSPDDLLRYVSWDFVKTLAEEARVHDIVEITGPADRRARRRTFRLQQRPSNTGESQWAWDQTELTIDPRQNLIERMVFDLKVVGVSVMRVELQLAEVNSGYRNEQFEARSWVPPGTREQDGDKGR